MKRPTEACYQAIGSRIRMLRNALGITQEDLAKRLRVTRTSLASIEIGRQRIRLDQVEEIAAAIGTTPRGLMKGIWW